MGDPAGSCKLQLGQSTGAAVLRNDLLAGVLRGELALAANQRSEALSVIQGRRVDRTAFKRCVGRPARVLFFKDVVDLADPALVAAFLDAGGVAGAGQPGSVAQLQQILGGEAAAVFGRLVGEDLAAQLVKSTRRGSVRQSVCRANRFDSEERSDSVLDGDRARRDLAAQQISGRFFKLATVGTLRILEDHQATPSALTADEHTALRSMTRRRFRRFHEPILPLAAPTNPAWESQARTSAMWLD